MKYKASTRTHRIGQGRIKSLRLAACAMFSLTMALGAAADVPPPASALAPLADFQKGICYTSWARGDYSSPTSDETLARIIKPMGVNWISVIVTCRQDTITSTEIHTDDANCTASDDDLLHVIAKAHSLGLRVMLKPHVDLSNDPTHWRGEINLKDDETAWLAWFVSYTTFIVHYADVARQAGADCFAVGTELVGTSRHSDRWREVIKAVRLVYPGPFIYAANWGEETRVDWWDAIDGIGVDAYYPFLTQGTPTVEQLTAVWTTRANRLGDLSHKWNRPVTFTEIGYRSIVGTHRDPADWHNKGTVDMQAQADCYEAVFKALEGRDWWHGAFWWDWSTNPAQGGPEDTGFTANNKPAEQILRKHYGAPPRP